MNNPAASKRRGSFSPVTFQQQQPMARCAKQGNEMKKVKGELEKKLDAFHAAIKAQALLIALEWAGGSTRVLSDACGGTEGLARQWIHRKELSPMAAFLLSKIEGFPLSAREMRPDVDFSRFKRIRCNGCGKRINAPSYRTGCRSPRNDSAKVKAAIAAASLKN
ncbi:hypothetical protein PQR71_13990 [Paraburkholderia fungorum]|uniref:hypothetical protein n=1 Tax=Paraburkholderia fungorum TaxID=134537 RepID=UPI0038B86B47